MVTVQAEGQQQDESVKTYADALRSMADRLGVSVHGGNVRSRFLKGLSNTHVRTKVEGMLFLLPHTFDALESAASFQEKVYRRDRLQKLTQNFESRKEKESGGATSGGLNPAAVTTGEALTSADFQRLLDENLARQQRAMEESFKRQMLKLKKDVAVQRQTKARSHLDKPRQTKPLGPCFTCNGDHLKKFCPIELAKRGKVSPVSMAELIELDISQAGDTTAVDEMISRFELFLEAESEFSTVQARQVALVEFGDGDCGDLVARVMMGTPDSVEDENGEDDEPHSVVPKNAAEESKRLLGLHHSTTPITGAGNSCTRSAGRSGGDGSDEKVFSSDEAAESTSKVTGGAEGPSAPNVSSGAKNPGDTYECLLPVTVLSRKQQVVADTGASHSIISYRLVRKLKLKKLIRPSKKAFVTAGGELSFPVDEIDALPVCIGGKVVSVSCTIVRKACFAMLLGLDVMKPMGVCINLEEDELSVKDKEAGRRVKVKLTCSPSTKTLNDIRSVSVGAVCMMKPIPSDQGPLQGRSLFPEINPLNAEDQDIVDSVRKLPTEKLTNKAKVRQRLKEKVVKKEKKFPDEACINPDLTTEQRQMVLKILEECRAAFISESDTLPCTDLVQHSIDTGDAAPVYVAPYRCSLAKERIIQQEVDEMLRLEVIRESKSAWGSSPVLVTKKTGDWRLCIDFRALN